MNIELSNDEMELIQTMLEKEIEEVRVEIHHTDKFEFKAELKQRERLIQSLSKRLKQSEHILAA